MLSFRLVALALALLPTCVAAQDAKVDLAGASDTAAFRAGQWGVQFGINSGLVNLGILRFTSPRSAWMLLFDANAEFLSGTQHDATGTQFEVHNRDVFFATGIGKRFYQAPRHKVRSFQSIGLAGSFSDQKQTYTNVTFTDKRWTAGILGELGAGYWVTPNLSLGATANASTGYVHEKRDDSTTQTNTSGWFVSGVGVRLIIGLYF